MDSSKVDEYIGQRLRIRRMELGLSQEALAKNVGISFQQIQKYERGKNRISASRLHEFSHILKIEESYFFGDLPNRTEKDDKSIGSEVYGFLQENRRHGFDHEDINSRDKIQLVRNYSLIDAPEVRKKLSELVKVIAETSQERKSMRGEPISLFPEDIRDKKEAK